MHEQQSCVLSSTQLTERFGLSSRAEIMARTMLITGTSSGIGRAAALSFACKGWCVFATVRQQQDADSLQQEFQGLQDVVTGGALHPVLLDITNEASVSKGMQQLVQACGDKGLNVLINNAGIAVYGPIETTSADIWRKVFETNVFGMATMTRNCLPLLRQAAKHKGSSSPGARVILVGSAAGRLAAPLQSVYTASKHAVEGIADSMRAELAPQGIKVVLMQLGAVTTSMGSKMRTASAGSTQDLSTQIAHSTSTDPSKVATAGELPSQSTHQQDVVALYEDQIQDSLELFDAMESQTIPMKVVLDALEKASTAVRPATRYPVDGQIALVLRLRGWMTDRMWDRFYPWASSITKKKAAKKR